MRAHLDDALTRPPHDCMATASPSATVAHAVRNLVNAIHCQPMTTPVDHRISNLSVMGSEPGDDPFQTSLSNSGPSDCSYNEQHTVKPLGTGVCPLPTMVECNHQSGCYSDGVWNPTTVQSRPLTPDRRPSDEYRSTAELSTGKVPSKTSNKRTIRISKSKCSKAFLVNHKGIVSFRWWSTSRLFRL
ncbi:unnamed protein product [Soboliphyme baturini]|uniref:Uncharacterized protein n=1 Tax=Soboliphyme baturini TaxID=241478 RepID=A0A183IUH3_9BILA|nr:unnamed protein product [Soboliphyme baturini]